MNKYPLISVIMGIYNCAETLSEAIDSIINQTYTNWEIILCDDCSKDNTYNIAEEYCKKYPEKIKLIRNKKNLGLNETLNNCLQIASGKYIARMDGDDISVPERFEKEIAFLENNLQYAIVSCQMEYFDEKGVFGKSKGCGEPLIEDIVKRTPFCHAPCMVRKEAYDAVEGYTVSKKLLRVEDYYLWIKMFKKGYKGYNLAETLYKMRDDRNAVNRRKYSYRINEAYVKAYAISVFKLKKINYLYVVKSLVVGLLPSYIYTKLHQFRLR